jgi:hypothetical protein
MIHLILQAQDFDVFSQRLPQNFAFGQNRKSKAGPKWISSLLKERSVKTYSIIRFNVVKIKLVLPRPTLEKVLVSLLLKPA